MRDNRPFTQKQDEIIRTLYEQQNIKKWSMIARTLTQDYNLPRNAKQCRDRYQQHLDPMMISQWTPEEEQKLYILHNQIGNKWAVIAQKFPGRTDNCVKNHFYAKLRKSLRHLNKVIKQNFKKQIKQLKIGAIYKIIEVLEDRFNQNTMIDQDVLNKCLRLKKQLLEYSDEQSSVEKQQFVKQRQLIQQIIQFSRSYKRKTKKQRRNSLNGIQLFKHSTIQKRIKYASDQQSSQSQYSLVHSHSQKQFSQGQDNQSQKSEGKLNIIQEDIRQSMNSNINIRESYTSNINIRESLTSNYMPTLRLTQKLSNEDKNQDKSQLKISLRSHQSGNIQDILKQKHLLQQIQVNIKAERSYCSVSVKSQSEKPDMFDDSIRISEGLRNIQQIDQQSPEENIFRSHR